MAISSIGSGTRDYSTVTAWLASLPATLTEQEVGQCYADSAFSESVTVSGFTTTESNNIVIEAASGQNPVWSYNGLGNTKWQISTPYTLINGLEFDGTEGNNSGKRAAFIATSHGSGYVTIKRCIVHGVISTASKQTYGIRLDDENTRIYSCLIYDIDAGSTEVSAIHDESSSQTHTVYNCTAYNIDGTSGGAFLLNGTSTIIKNCVAGNNTANDFAVDGANTNHDYNMSEDTTAPGTNSITSITIANQFTDPSTEDFTVQDTDADIYHGGTDLTSIVPTDLAGNSFDTPNPSVGAYEYVSAATPDSYIFKNKFKNKFPHLRI